jgi:hypothetical protein
MSKTLGPKLRGLSTYEKEYIAILLAVEQWRSYLQFQEFVIATDHQSLSHLNEQRLHTHWQQKVFSKLLGLKYRIVYKKGLDNKVADALSRNPSHCVEPLPSAATCHAISAAQPKWLDEVVASYDNDPFAKETIASLMLNPNVSPDYQSGTDTGTCIDIQSIRI